MVLDEQIALLVVVWGEVEALDGGDESVDDEAMVSFGFRCPSAGVCAADAGELGRECGRFVAFALLHSRRRGVRVFGGMRLGLDAQDLFRKPREACGEMVAVHRAEVDYVGQAAVWDISVSLPR